MPEIDSLDKSQFFPPLTIVDIDNDPQVFIIENPDFSMEEASSETAESNNIRGEFRNPSRTLFNPRVKESEVKKMFRRIASVTHPDKIGKDVPNAQKHKLDKIFKKAKDAYTNGSWYILYSISLDLGLDVPEPTTEHIEWLEGDIQHTVGRASHLGSLLVWVWFTGGEDSKKFALQNYFQQVYDYTLSDLP